MSVSLEGEPMNQFGPAIDLRIDGPFYVGIGFCSHPTSFSRTPPVKYTSQPTQSSEEESRHFQAAWFLEGIVPPRDGMVKGKECPEA